VNSLHRFAVAGGLAALGAAASAAAEPSRTLTTCTSDWPGEAAEGGGHPDAL